MTVDTDDDVTVDSGDRRVQTRRRATGGVVDDPHMRMRIGKRLRNSVCAVLRGPNGDRDIQITGVVLVQQFLDGVPQVAADIVAGKVKGRVVVDIR